MFRHIPLFFTICINDLLAEFEDNAFVSAYAIDPLIASSFCNENMILASLQPEVDKLVAWSAKARLTLKSLKCRTAYFSLGCAEAAWQPNITIDGKQMFCKSFPIFLCVRYDRQLTFGEHVRKLCQSIYGRINLALGGTS